jgi:threonine dehydrogenase-like Zn-dependent dehydrogenase
MCALAAIQVFGSQVLIADLVPERLEAARKLGVGHTVNPAQKDLPSEVSAWWPGNAEHVIDAVGSDRTKNLSLELAEPGGTVVWLGLQENKVTVDSYAITLQQLTVAGSYGATLDDLRGAVDVLSRSAIDLSWIKTFSLDHGEIAFRSMLEGRRDNIKGILQISEAS